MYDRTGRSGRRHGRGVPGSRRLVWSRGRRGLMVIKALDVPGQDRFTPTRAWLDLGRASAPERQEGRGGGKKPLASVSGSNRRSNSITIDGIAMQRTRQGFTISPTAIPLRTPLMVRKSSGDFFSRIENQMGRPMRDGPPTMTAATASTGSVTLQGTAFLVIRSIDRAPLLVLITLPPKIPMPESSRRRLATRGLGDSGYSFLVECPRN